MTTYLVGVVLVVGALGLAVMWMAGTSSTPAEGAPPSWFRRAFGLLTGRKHEQYSAMALPVELALPVGHPGLPPHGE